MVHVVDDDESLRLALMRLLRAVGYNVYGYSCAGDFLIKRPGEQCGCVLLDVKMPGPGGFELHEALVHRGVNLPVIFMTGHGDIAMSVRAMKAGAVDFLPKPVEREALLAAVKTALSLSAAIREQQSKYSRWSARLESLTPREHEVMNRVVAGHLNKQIAAELGASERTIKAHRANVMAKMEVMSVAELVEVAHELRHATVRPGYLCSGTVNTAVV